VGQIFDKIAGALERWVSSASTAHEATTAVHAKKILSCAHLFTFDKPSQDFLPKSYTEEEAAFANENFFLPFKTIAIEDAATMTLLSDDEKHHRGAAGNRLVFDVAIRGTNKVNFAKDDPDIPWLPGQQVVMTTGVVSCLRFGAGIGAVNQANVGEIVSISFYEDGHIELVTGAQAHALGLQTVLLTRQALIKNALVAFHEVLYINNPDYFIISEQNDHEVERQRKRNGNRIARTHQRPTYKALRPTEIRKRLRLSLEKGASPRVHERRAHIRRFRSEKFTHKRGQVKIIKACWVGKSTAQIDGRTYRVLLNLRPPLESSGADHEGLIPGSET